MLVAAALLKVSGSAVQGHGAMVGGGGRQGSAGPPGGGFGRGAHNPTWENKDCWRNTKPFR